MKLKVSQFFQSSLNVFLFRHMSAHTAQAYLQALGFLYYLVNRREKELISANVREVLAGQDARSVHRVIRATFKGIFTHYFEKMFAAYRDHRVVHRYVDRHFTVQGAELLRAALRGGKGCILVTAHWGAVEFIPWVLHSIGVPASIIVECATARLARCLQVQVTGHDIELITAGGGLSVYQRALASLAQNRVLMTQCDEVDAWRRRRTHTIRLFGRELYFDNTIDILAHRSGAPVVAAFLRRGPAGRYVLHLEDVSVQREAQSTARECLGRWESWVQRFPEQWYQWKKWREMLAA